MKFDEAAAMIFSYRCPGVPFLNREPCGGELRREDDRLVCIDCGLGHRLSHGPNNDKPTITTVVRVS